MPAGRRPRIDQAGGLFLRHARHGHVEPEHPCEGASVEQEMIAPLGGRGTIAARIAQGEHSDIQTFKDVNRKATGVLTRAGPSARLGAGPAPFTPYLHRAEHRHAGCMAGWLPRRSRRPHHSCPPHVRGIPSILSLPIPNRDPASTHLHSCAGHSHQPTAAGRRASTRAEPAGTFGPLACHGYQPRGRRPPRRCVGRRQPRPRDGAPDARRRRQCPDRHI